MPQKYECDGDYVQAWFKRKKYTKNHYAAFHQLVNCFFWHRTDWSRFYSWRKIFNVVILICPWNRIVKVAWNDDFSLRLKSTHITIFSETLQFVLTKIDKIEIVFINFEAIEFKITTQHMGIHGQIVSEATTPISHVVNNLFFSFTRNE